MRRALLLVPAIGLAACGLVACDSTTPGNTVAISYDFGAGPQGWTAGFADHRPGDDGFLELMTEYRPLPQPLGPGSALFISGNNHTDDLFMFFAREATGLMRNMSYRVTSEVRIATDVPHDCGGAGGSPGESVWLKAGAATDQPRVRVDADGWLRISVDKANQAASGTDLVVLGTIGNSQACSTGTGLWEFKTLKSTPGASTVRSSPGGSVWLVVGTDSGFEATTSIYYASIAVTLDPVP